MAKITFPVFMKEKGKSPPDKDIYFIVAKNGLFLRKRNGWIDSVVPVKQIDVLEEQAISAKIQLPKLPGIIIAKTVAFFQKIKEEKRSEALVLLHYNPDEGWELSVPKQSVGAASVDYDRSERLPGYNCMGTIHSHPNFEAFHSHTDKGDEKDWDGVHITIGNLDKDNCFSIDAEIVVNGCHFPLPISWLENLVEIKKESDSKPYLFVKATETASKFRICCPELGNWKVPEDWLKKVERKAFFAVGTIFFGQYQTIEEFWADYFHETSGGRPIKQGVLREKPTTATEKSVTAPKPISPMTRKKVVRKPSTRIIVKGKAHAG